MTRELAKLNFRDVGGHRTADGSHVRRGMIFRSEGPASFGPVHREELSALGFRLVCDLRGATEREKSPNDWIGSARLLNLDINSDLRASPGELLTTMGPNPSVDQLLRATLHNYSLTPAALRPRLRSLIESIADAETPALIHCTAGKDRTGVLVALLLLALGVPEETVLADYLRSAVFGQNLRARGGLNEQIERVFGFLPDDAFIDVLIGVDVELLDAALTSVRSTWGSVDAYFQAAGVDAELMGRYREAMVVPRGDVERC
jgi:protein-tyrosine phosphatase